MSYNSRVSRFRHSTAAAATEEHPEEAAQKGGDTLDMQEAVEETARGGIAEPQAELGESEAETPSGDQSEGPERGDGEQKRRGRKPMTEEQKAAAKAAREAKKLPATQPEEPPAITTKADVKAALKAVEQQVADELARSAAALKELRAKHLELSAKLFDLNASN